MVGAWIVVVKIVNEMIPLEIGNVKFISGV